MAKHALLNASGVDRWENCPPSARLQEHEENTSSVFAREDKNGARHLTERCQALNLLTY